MTDESKRLLALLQAKKDNPVRLDIVGKLQSNFADNKTYLALTAPTSNQNTKQIQLLTRTINRLIKLALNDLANPDS